MRSGRNLFALITLLFLALFTVACSQSDPEAEKAAADAEAWTALEGAKQELDAKRQELAELMARIEAGPPEDATPAADAADGAEGDAEVEPMPTAEELAASADELKKQVDALTTSFTTQLVSFINSQGITEGQELTEQQRKAFDMKANEDILVAMEFIDKGGEYPRAIDILSGSLVHDPTNEALLAAKAKAEELRYMTQERFDQVKKGMTIKEVRALLGIPKLVNQREFENGITGWFYQKEEPNTAAGIFYQKKNDQLVVYKIDFDAVKAQDAAGSE
jgi:hypothetical protein